MCVAERRVSLKHVLESGNVKKNPWKKQKGRLFCSTRLKELKLKTRRRNFRKLKTWSWAGIWESKTKFCILEKSFCPGSMHTVHRCTTLYTI